LLFAGAGTLRYWQGWAYLGVYFGCSLPILVYLMKNNPVLLRHRMSGGPTAEKTKPQNFIMGLASAGFIASIVVPALDHRFGWSRVSIPVVIAGYLLMFIWFWIMFLVFKENTFASATIEISENQTVVSTGPYAVVRHPMYAGGLLLFISTPLALGSYWGLLSFLVVLPALLWRLLDEERFLKRNLPGYTAYCAKVKYRLLPWIW